MWWTETWSFPNTGCEEAETARAYDLSGYSQNGAGEGGGQAREGEVVRGKRRKVQPSNGNGGSGTSQVCLVWPSSSPPPSSSKPGAVGDSGGLKVHLSSSVLFPSNRVQVIELCGACKGDGQLGHEEAYVHFDDH